jgi:hypothetical protein
VREKALREETDAAGENKKSEEEKEKAVAKF